MSENTTSLDNLEQWRGGGIASVERGRTKRRLTLQWLLRWRLSSSRVLCQYLGIAHRTLMPGLRRLEQEGLIRRAPTYGCVEQYVWMLTQQGANLATLWLGRELPSFLDPHRLNHRTLTHDLSLQWSVASYLSNNLINHWIPEFELVDGRDYSGRRPDALVMTTEHNRYFRNELIALELEASHKDQGTRRDIWHSYRHAINRGAGQFTGVLWVSHSEPLLSGTKRAFESCLSSQEPGAERYWRGRHQFDTTPATIEGLQRTFWRGWSG